MKEATKMNLLFLSRILVILACLSHNPKGFDGDGFQVPRSLDVSSKSLSVSLAGQQVASPEETALELYNPLRSRSKLIERTENITKDLANFRQDISLEDVMNGFVISNELAGAFPPSDNIFIGIGRSPFLITEIMNLRGAACWQLPLTWSDTKFKENLNLEPSQVELQNLYAHFKNYLPDPETLADRSLVFIDFELTGISLWLSEKFIRKYYESLEVDPDRIKVASLSLSNENDSMPEELQNSQMVGNWFKINLLDDSLKSFYFANKLGAIP